MKQLKGLMLFLALIGLFVFACEKDEPFNEPEQTHTEEIADLRANTCTSQASSFSLTKDVELIITVCAETPEDAKKEGSSATAILDAIKERFFTGESLLNPNCGEYDCNNASKNCVLGDVKAKAKDSEVVEVTPLPPDPTNEDCPEGEQMYTVKVKIEKLRASVKCECEKIETD